MKKVVAVCLLIMITLLMVACKNANPASVDAQSDPTIEAENATAYSFAQAPKIYSDPDNFKGKEYSSLFQIGSEKMPSEDEDLYYASGYTSGRSIQTLTVLSFQKESAPELAMDEIVFVRGTIEGKASFFNGAGDSVDALWLTVTQTEQDVSYANLSSGDKQYTFNEGECVAQTGPLTIEVAAIDFYQDQTVLMTRTIDESVKNMTTYYFDIIIHQNGYFAWYPDCNFWIDGQTGFDTVPFPQMDSSQNMTIDFVPYDENGALIYEPLTININLENAS